MFFPTLLSPSFRPPFIFSLSSPPTPTAPLCHMQSQPSLLAIPRLSFTDWQLVSSLSLYRPISFPLYSFRHLIFLSLYLVLFSISLSASLCLSPTLVALLALSSCITNHTSSLLFFSLLTYAAPIASSSCRNLCVSRTFATSTLAFSLSLSLAFCHAAGVCN